MSTPVAYAEQLTRDAEALYTAVEATASHDPTVCVASEDDARIQVYDAVLADPIAYRAEALDHTFVTHMDGMIPWHGFAACALSEFTDWLMVARPDITPTLSFFRQSPEGQAEPNYIHTDSMMGDWTVILYLTDTPHPEDGTIFWKHQTSLEIGSHETTSAAQAEWTDRAQWIPYHHVLAQFNRVVIFPAQYFHSRSIYDNYGTGVSARLVQVVFGTTKKES